MHFGRLECQGLRPVGTSFVLVGAGHRLRWPAGGGPQAVAGELLGLALTPQGLSATTPQRRRAVWQSTQSQPVAWRRRRLRRR